MLRDLYYFILYWIKFVFIFVFLSHFYPLSVFRLTRAIQTFAGVCELWRHATIYIYFLLFALFFCMFSCCWLVKIPFNKVAQWKMECVCICWYIVYFRLFYDIQTCTSTKHANELQIDFISVHFMYVNCEQ